MPAEMWRALGLDPDRFALMYAGIMNPPQGVDVLLDAIAKLRAAAPDLAKRLQLAMVGAGSLREHLLARVQSEGLGEHVRVVAEQPRDAIPPLLRTAHAIAVTLRPRKDAHTVPSKLYGAMAGGRPVLVSADGAPAKILRGAKAGLGIRRSGEAVKRDAVSFDRGCQVERFEEVLRFTLARRKGGIRGRQRATFRD